MIRIEISDDRCQIEVKGELGLIAFEFSKLTSHLAANMPEGFLKQAFEDGLYINEHGMEAFKKKMVETIEKFKSEEFETEDVEDDDDSDRGKFKDTVTMIASALAAAALLGGRNDKNR